MKKLFSILFILILSINISFAYTPTAKDKILLNKVYSKIWPIVDKAPTKIEPLQSKISELKAKFKDNERIYYIFTELENFIAGKIKKNINYKVISVADGDTVTVTAGTNKLKIRMIWIDAPESSRSRFGYIECYWKESWDYLKNMLDWKTVQLEYDLSQWKTDIYNRTLAYVHYNWENINQKLIAEWYAWEYLYDESYKYQEDFESAQTSAQTEQLWLWNELTCNWERKAITDKNNSNTDEENSSEEYQCWTKRYCTQMNSCEEARYFLNTCGLDRLDSDNDWIPCEAICK